MNNKRFPFAVFCERAYEKDHKPESVHKTFEAAQKAAEKYEKQFFRSDYNSNALISYSVYELNNTGSWDQCLVEDI